MARKKRGRPRIPHRIRTLPKNTLRYKLGFKEEGYFTLMTIHWLVIGPGTAILIGSVFFLLGFDEIYEFLEKFLIFEDVGIFQVYYALSTLIALLWWINSIAEIVKERLRKKKIKKDEIK